MTLIKRGAPLSARATSLASRAFAGAPFEGDLRRDDIGVEQAPQDRLIADLSSRIADLETKIQAAGLELEKARADAFAQGRAEGIEAAETLERERLQELSLQLDAAVAALGDHIDEERDLAIDIARAALNRLFTDPSLYAGMIAETARRQASALARGTVLALRVSAKDFPDQERLALLPPLGTEVRVEVDASLPHGACIFDLTLGSLDASIDRQASIIESVFAQVERKVASA